MPTEIIVIVENQDPRSGIFLAIEIGGSQTTDAGPYDDEIVGFFGLARWPCLARNTRMHCLP